MESKRDSPRTERKIVEKNRRNQMKNLCIQLSSLIPTHNSKEVSSLVDQLDEATDYIKALENQLDILRKKKLKLEGVISVPGNPRTDRKRSPEIEIRCVGSALEVILIAANDCQPMFYKIIRVLHQEGADIVNASFSVVNDSIIHTIHSEVIKFSIFDMMK
ncbi:hypothetical protein ACHQM5_017283 [Ranunculus cassubicifolius]